MITKLYCTCFVLPTYSDKWVYGSTLNRTNKCHSTENKCISRVIKYESTTKEYVTITNTLNYHNELYNTAVNIPYRHLVQLIWTK